MSIELRKLLTSIGRPYVVRAQGAGHDIMTRVELLGSRPYELNFSGIRSDQEFFDVFRVALRMPYTTITNWDALDETLADLSWLSPKEITFVLLGAEEIFQKNKSTFFRMIEMLDDLGCEWSKPVNEGEWWDRAPVPFHALVINDGSMKLPLPTIKLHD